MSNFVDILGKTITFSDGAVYATELRNKGTDDSTQKLKGTNPLTTATNVRLTSQTLNSLNNCTFMYDRNWVNTMQGTLPVCFFFTKSMQEVMDTQVTEKTLIFYHEDTGKSDDSKKAVTQVISDNIVVKPKTYQLEVLIPYAMSQVINSNFMQNVRLIPPDLLASNIAEVNYSVSVVTAVIKALFDSFDSVASLDFSSDTSATISALGEKDYNKKSLEAMWKNRSLCVMKTWDGWNFKDVAITGLHIDKKPDEDNMYRGTITVQEVPVFTMLAQNKLISLNPLYEAKQKKAREENNLLSKALATFNTAGA